MSDASALPHKQICLRYKSILQGLFGLIIGFVCWGEGIYTAIDRVYFNMGYVWQYVWPGTVGFVIFGAVLYESRTSLTLRQTFNLEVFKTAVAIVLWAASEPFGFYFLLGVIDTFILIFIFLEPCYEAFSAWNPEKELEKLRGQIEMHRAAPEKVVIDAL